MTEGNVYYEENIIEQLRVEPLGYVSVVHVLVEDNLVKKLIKMNWNNPLDLLNFIRSLVYEKDYLYDDEHTAYSRRHKLDGKNVRDTYQLMNSDIYAFTKKELDLE